MTLPALSPHNFAATGNMEAALCPFMGFDFWHTALSLFFGFLDDCWRQDYAHPFSIHRWLPLKRGYLV